MVLVIDPQTSGISGDMFLCSLVDMGADRSQIIDGIMSCSRFLPDSTIHAIDFAKNNKNGIDSTELILDISEDTSQRRGSDMRQAIIRSSEHLALSQEAKAFAESCITSLVDAESVIHGVPADSVHFHETSSIDTLVDIVGVAMSMDDLGLFDEHIACMPIAVGAGSVTFSHGTMSNPASAILEILKGSGLSICGSAVGEELTTPTGACILKNMKAVPMDFYPKMTITSIGYGSGKKCIEGFSNVLKTVCGVQKHAHASDSVKILETNVDDVSGELLGSMIERIMARGARDVSVYPGITKKNRPTNLITVICDSGCVGEITDTIIEETGTLGIRVRDSERLVLPRTSNKAAVRIGGRSFDVSYKTSSFKGRTRLKIEFDDLQAVSDSLNMPLAETEYLIRKEIERNEDADGRN